MSAPQIHVRMGGNAWSNLMQLMYVGVLQAMLEWIVQKVCCFCFNFEKFMSLAADIHVLENYVPKVDLLSKKLTDG